MTGPGHYREAERLIGEAHSISDGYGTAEYAQALGEAQVHATLALAAATALASFGDMPADDSDAWLAATRTPPKAVTPDE